MKGLAKALVFIFLCICTIFGLAVNKGYGKYIAKNMVIELFIKAVVFLAILRCSLMLIVPLIKSILEYLNISDNTLNFEVLKHLNDPLVIFAAGSLTLYYSIHSAAEKRK